MERIEGGIVTTRGDYTIRRERKGFGIWREGLTHATKVATCSASGERGLEWCRREIDRRLTERCFSL